MYANVCMYACTHIQPYIDMHMYLHTHMYVYVRISLCMYIYIYTYIEICVVLRWSMSGTHVQECARWFTNTFLGIWGSRSL